MLTVLVILAVAGILFGAGVVATHDGEVLRDPQPDDRGAALPETSVQPEDVAELRFDMAVRGYRMAEVDAALARLAEELASRDQRIGELERALVDAEEPAAPTAEPAVAEEPAPAAVDTFEPLEPLSAAPAAISGPLTATTWFTEPAPEHTEPEPAPEPVPAASAPVGMPDAPAERTQEPELPEAAPEPASEPAPEPVASAPVDEVETPFERTQEPAPPPREALTLTAADDAFSFPELLPAEPEPEPAPAAPALPVEPAAAEGEDPTGEDPPRA